MRGDEMNKAMRKMPPVQGLSQPYTWPIPTGMALKSCRSNKITQNYGGKTDNPNLGWKPSGAKPSTLTYATDFQAVFKLVSPKQDFIF